MCADISVRSQRSILSSLRVAIALCVAALPHTAAAQLAPTGGHYGGRSSDTGFTGPINPTGGFSASVPIDLPPARGSLPVPFQISYGARGVGAAGLGWEIPLSYVRRDTTFARRRPASFSLSPTARPQVTLSLEGRMVELISNGGTTWIARRDGPDLLAREQNGGWVLYDSEGRTYAFTQPSVIAGTGLWLLTSVTGAGGSKVLLEYGYDTLNYGGGSALTINLLRVSWNFQPNSTCAKHQLILSYGTPTATPLSLEVVGTTVVGRNRVLVNLDLRSRATCADALERLRQYLFGYSADADTQLPRLTSVKLRGRIGTAEAVVELPVASYTYGSATTAGKFVYQSWPNVSVPFDADGTKISSTDFDFGASLPPAAVGNPYSTWESLTDVTGDGRPDLVYRKTGKLWVAQNRPIVGGGVTFTTPTSQAQLHDSTFASGPFELRSLQRARIGGDPVPNIEEVWRQSIDVNGDGRMDVIDAGESANSWTIYLNTPSATASGVTWVKRTWSTVALRQYLVDRGHPVNQGYVPLARRHTGHRETWGVCVRWNGSAWEDFPAGWGSPECAGVPQGLIDSGPERTFTEWEVTDFNGDGYPDVLMNTSPVRKHEVNVPPPPSPNGSQLLGYGRVLEVQPTAGASNQVDAALNRRGVMFDLGLDQFASPANVATDLCGVAMWVDEPPGATTDPSTQRLSCGHTDVNGDGLLDRVRGATARLGTGLSFSGIAVPLPGSLAVQKSQQLSTCTLPIPNPVTYSAWHETGLRDMTGDGLPDYVDGSTFPTRVFIGTGVGFTAAVPVDLGSPNTFIHLSNETENCNGTRSQTNSGVYDVDGDGVADLISIGSSTMRMSRLVGGADSGAAGAGRLTRIENGYGARTTVSYGSAKDEGTRHHVPFPEIVVTAVETAGTQGLGGDLAKVRYAYGIAERFFDSAADRWIFPGYGRRLELRVPTANPEPVQAEGQLIVTDTWDLAPFAFTPKPERLGRYLRAGRTKNVTVFDGLFRLRVELHMSIDVAADNRRTSMTHFRWDPVLVEEPNVPWSGECMDVMYPYDWNATFVANLTHPQLNVCTAHGFVYARSNDTWRGTTSPPSQNAVATRSEVWNIDNYGRPLLTKHENDVNRGDDDFCVYLQYPTPIGTDERVLNAPSSRWVASCPGDSGPPVTWAAEFWEYDGLAYGSISKGLPTGHIVERRATQTGALLTAIRTFDATYDLAANPVAITSAREDGAQRTVTLDYDPFGLQVVRTRTNATGTPQLEETLALDPMSLEPLASIDANGTARGLQFDGFGRVTRTTLRPPGGSVGVLSVTRYLGFSGVPPLERRVETTRYQDPVAPGAVGTAVGRVATGYLDELGRSMRTDVQLGGDYANETMVIGSRLYDSFGRVRFEADPYPMSQSSTAAYGTSFHFRSDGTPWCFVRGRGPQPLTVITDPTNEVFPTCFSRFFSGYSEFIIVRDPASLEVGSNQDGTIRYTELSALGRLVSRSTWKNGVRLEHATFSHDRLGQLRSMTRYLDPATPGNPVQTTWEHDSLGQVTQWQDPESAAQFISYSNWGEQLEVQWLDATVSPSVTRQVRSAYDALGRLTHREERNNGTTDADSVFDYFYDVGTILVPQVVPTHVKGRLARAKAPTGDVYFSYDPFGRVNARVFTDPQLTKYVEKTVFHGEGAPRGLQFFLPDNSFLPEQVDYTYDSAARLRKVKYTDSAGSVTLYDATQIDPFGRVRSATYGGTTVYSAIWAETGRRLMNESRLDSLLESRRIEYTGYDPVGRERTRREYQNGVHHRNALQTYDALGRLAASFLGSTTTGPLQNWSFGYDALGNATLLADGVAARDAAMSHRSVDRDRLCRIGYGEGGLGGTACNVVHDAVGNVVQQPTRTGSRTLEYFASGAVRRIVQGAATATFKYDPFGAVQTLDVVGVAAASTRHDRRYGELIEKRDVVSGGTTTSMIVRQIPGPGGIVASKRGSAWVFPFAEQRGSRTFVDKTGAFVQEVSYQAFGEPGSTGAQPGSATYSPEQWNGGDALEPFGLAHLGARLYDPVIGRFLSRDPLVVPRAAASTNPYAFAMNDPVNRADPTGLDCYGPECHPPGGGGQQVPGGGPSPINDPCLYISCASPAGGVAPAKSTYVAPELTLIIPHEWSDKLVSGVPAVTITQPVEVVPGTDIGDDWDWDTFAGPAPSEAIAAAGEALDAAFNQGAKVGDPMDVAKWLAQQRQVKWEDLSRALNIRYAEWLRNSLGGNYAARDTALFGAAQALRNQRSGLHEEWIGKYNARASGAWKVARVAGTLGTAGDVLENTLAIIDFAVDPSARTAYGVVKTGIGTVLMGLGPGGWAMKFVGIPAFEAIFTAEPGPRARARIERTGMAWFSRR
jgi:RHS repeat-associated protein